MLLLSLLLLLGFSLGMYRHWRRSGVAFYYWPALLLKIVAGWGLLLLYQEYYGYGDMLVYHRQASELGSLFWQDATAYAEELAKMGLWKGAGGYKGYARADFFIRLISPLYILSANHAWLVSAWLSLLSFMGLFWLVNVLSVHFQGSGLAAAIAFLFWPSMLFFTGSITKEAVVMPAIAVLVAAFLPLMMGRVSKHYVGWLFCVLLAWLLWRIKYYFALPLFAVLLALVLARWLVDRAVVKKSLLPLLAVLFLLAGWLLAPLLHPNLQPEHVLQVLVENYRASLLLGGGNKHLHFDQLEPTIWCILYYTPKALAGGLLMPLPFIPLRLELLPLLAGAENLTLLFLIIGAYYKLYCLHRTPVSLAAAGVICYVGVLAVAMAIASPNLGTLMRYRTAYLPFAVFLVLYWLFRPERQLPKNSAALTPPAQ